MQVHTDPCRICGGTGWTTLYHGPIRTGGAKDHSSLDHAIFQCEECGAGFLPRPPVDYADDDYRETVDGGASPQLFQQQHDAEQSRNLLALGTGELRGKIIADIGCGAGSFVDVVSGMAAQTIAVEPARSYRKTLESNGHKAYSYTSEALADWESKVDIAVSFAVVEHIEDPVSFLRDIEKLLKPGGFLLMSTPNRNDAMLELLPEDYGRFFYRTAHTWYFDGASIRRLGAAADFDDAEIKYTHRFDLSNGLLWLRNRRPTGLGAIDLFSSLDATWRNHLEQTGRSDFLYARMYKEQ